ncbi:ferredoxin [Rhodococcus sp. SRB_17]|uniref:ferredoxin n=1 Tax=unclassified Rhodococcus (in: high G+C Gram-positive bacteria) TaxID=192944 RepID=UPI000B946297|nr:MULTISPECIES: ferredoxin [unclassified Rhodococcus (in: high G+C Gram-positive bacteria)]MCJ0903113.1 ferredoxin [Rhodococcus sp. ARC_M6]NMM86521.1 ferredoxin [Rhodococcus sp. SRB_17]OYD68280.1 3-phenylpropionate/trans-cinnamate dioxygenase ferredoxin reductase subunit [Rhodococcus sp. OK302]
MAILKANLDLCQGYANCVVAADDVYDMDDDGLVVLLKARVDESDRQRVETAAKSCPANALWLEDE